MVTSFNPLRSHFLLFTVVRILQNVITVIEICYISLNEVLSNSGTWSANVKQNVHGSPVVLRQRDVCKLCEVI